MLYNNLKTFLIAAAITSHILTACGPTATATPATQTPEVREVVKTIVITTTPAPTPKPQVILIEPSKNQLGKVTDANYVEFGSHGQFIRSDETVDVLMIHAIRDIHYSTMGMDVCDGNVPQISWDPTTTGGWIKAGETARIAMTAEDANVGDHCQWVQWIQLSLSEDDKVQEDHYLLMDVTVRP